MTLDLDPRVDLEGVLSSLDEFSVGRTVVGPSGEPGDA